MTRWIAQEFITFLHAGVPGRPYGRYVVEFKMVLSPQDAECQPANLPTCQPATRIRVLTV